MSKKVVQLQEQLRRARGERKLNKRFLIVCEDGESAPNYFDAFIKHFGIPATSVEIVPSGGHTQPASLVNLAIDRKRRSEREQAGTEPFAAVWCVIDGDYGLDIPPARRLADAHRIDMAVSTMCFEHWLVLHFDECDTASPDCAGVNRQLKRRERRPEYAKGNPDFTPIMPRVHDASRRAEKLRKPGLRRGDLPENQNPCTEVYLLVDALLDARPAAGE